LKTFVKIAAHLRRYFCLLKNMIVQNLSQSSPKCATCVKIEETDILLH